MHLVLEESGDNGPGSRNKYVEDEAEHPQALVLDRWHRERPVQKVHQPKIPKPALSLGEVW